MFLKKTIFLDNFIKLFFSSRIFPLILGTSSIIPIYKKESRIECSNCRPIYLFSNIDKVLKKDESIIGYKVFC